MPRPPKLIAASALAAVVTLLYLAVLSPGGAEETRARPNVVVVMTDDQDLASLRVMSAVERRLAERGVTFENSYVGLSECCPSRATFLTGQHAHNHGVTAARPPAGGYSALDNENTLAVWLDDAGYRTAHVGRYLNYYGNPAVGTNPREIPPGWDEWHAAVKHTDFQVYDYEFNHNGRLRRYGNRARDYITEFLARRSSRFIHGAARTEEPFFLWVTPPLPHSEGVLDGIAAARNPRPAPRDEGAFADSSPRPTPSVAETDTSDKPAVVREQQAYAPGAAPAPDVLASYRGRLESLLAVDRMVGGIVGALRQTGELENTYVVFTSDNGFLLGEHGLTGKHLAYEETVRVPLVIRGPGLPEGVRRSEPVQNIDLAPTIVDLADATPERRMDGVSLLPAATGSDDRDRDLLIEFLETRRRFAAVRSHDGFKYVEWVDGSKELYDLRRDPWELTNLAGDPAFEGQQERLAARLEILRDCAGSACQ